MKKILAIGLALCMTLAISGCTDQGMFKGVSKTAKDMEKHVTERAGQLEEQLDEVQSFLDDIPLE